MKSPVKLTIKFTVTNLISNHIFKHYQYVLSFSCALLINIFMWIIHITWLLKEMFRIHKMFHTNIFTFVNKQLLLWFIYIFGMIFFSIFCWWCIKLCNPFVFLDPEPPTILILYRYSGIRIKFEIYCYVFSCLFCIIKVNHYIQFFIFVYSINSILHTLPYEYNATSSSICRLLSC